MKIQDVILCLLTMFLWGAQVTAVKVAGHELPPFFMLLFRFAIISICLFPFAKKITLESSRRMALIACFSTVLHFGFLYVGIGMVTAATSAIIYQLSPIFTIILAALFLGDRLTWSSIAGILLSFGGVALLFSGFNFGGSVIGGACIALAALSFATGTILIKRMGPFDPITLNTWSAIFAIPVVLGISLETEPWSGINLLELSNNGLIALIYAAISGGIIAFAIWYRLLNKYSISQLAPYTLLVPIFAVGVSEFLLHEGLDLKFLLAAFLVIAGVFVSQFKVLDRQRTLMRN